MPVPPRLPGATVRLRGHHRVKEGKGECLPFKKPMRAHGGNEAQSQRAAPTTALTAGPGGQLACRCELWAGMAPARGPAASLNEEGGMNQGGCTWPAPLLSADFHGLQLTRGQCALPGTIGGRGSSVGREGRTQPLPPGPGLPISSSRGHEYRERELSGAGLLGTRLALRSVTSWPQSSSCLPKC